MVALATVLRALFGYFFLVFVVRIVGRRPGKQLTPFEFVLIFFLGGLALTGMVANEVSLTNAICQTSPSGQSTRSKDSVAAYRRCLGKSLPAAN